MKLPVHLNALRAFEASARHQSFSAAATELHVTAAAVGQLVRSLEDWLGMPVFQRASSGRTRLIPTEAAEQALPEIRAGFERLASGLARLQDASPGRGALTVTCSPAFAAKWLLPRIERFQTAWPEIELRLDTSHKPVDFIAQRIDLGIRYGAGRWPGLQAEKLMDEEIYPVCSPRLMAQAPERLRQPADLLGQVLIHDLSMDGHADFPSWERWLQQMGVAGATAPLRGLSINNSAAVLQAAAEGQGVALARSVMAHDDLAAGRLLRLFPDLSCRPPLAYHLVHRGEGRLPPKLMAFRDWLFAEAAADPAASTATMPV